MTAAWPVVPLGEVLKPVSRPEPVDPSVTYRVLGAHWYAKGLYVKEVKPGSEIRAGKLFRVEKGDFVYNRLFAWKGSFAIATQENHGCYVSNEFPCFSMDQDHVVPQYLRLYFSRSSVWQEALGLSTGGTPTSRNRLKEEKLLGFSIPLPPLPEQRRVVVRIEGLAAKIDEARSLRRQAFDQANALSLSVLSEILSEPGGARHRLADLCLQITDGEHATPPRIPERGIPLVTAKNVRDGYLDLGSTDFVDYDTAEKCWRRCRPQADDVLMVCVGATTGRVCRLVNPPSIVIVRSVAMLRPDKNIIDPRFLEYALESPDCQNQIWASVKQAAQPCLYIHRMEELSLRVPPLSEQRRIVTYVDGLQAKADSLKSLQNETAAELDAMLPSILDKTFKGEL